MMAESVLSTAQADLSEFGINPNDEPHLGPAGMTAAVSDLATIVETVSLGDASEDEALAPQQQSDKPAQEVAGPEQPSGSTSEIGRASCRERV